MQDVSEEPLERGLRRILCLSSIPVAVPGKPKGVLHTTGGYLLWATMTAKTVFDLRDDDVFWCTADVGWITGHTYLTYGPTATGPPR